MDLKVIYVTVGTTKFDALIKTILSDQVLSTLQARNCKKMVLQLGNSECSPVDADRVLAIYGIELEKYTFRSNLSDIDGADLIIGHAGAGTCMDVLNNNKAALIVVNDALMDNHQLELAQQLADEGYIYYCNVSQVPGKLETLNFGNLKPYKSNASNMSKFVQALNELMSI